MPRGDVSEKWSECYNKLTSTPRSSDEDVLMPHYQRFLPSLVLVSTANTLSSAADNKKKKKREVTSHCAWQQGGSYARIATALNPGRPHRVALVVPVRCVGSFSCLLLSHQKLFKLQQQQQIESDFTLGFFPPPLSDAYFQFCMNSFQAVLLIYCHVEAVLFSSRGHAPYLANKSKKRKKRSWFCFTAKMTKFIWN